MKNAKTYFSSAREREAIRRRRASGAPAPWTKDPVLRAWRFCNVHRENDKTTTWFREQVRNRVTDPLRLVEAVVAFRWFNKIETGQRILPLLLDGWDSKRAKRRLDGVQPIVTGAYMVNTPAGYKKLDGVLWCIDSAREYLPTMVPRWGASLQAAFDDLVTIPRVGKFVAYEIVSDLRWTPVLDRASDILTWANAGPGCARGLGYVVADDPTRFNYMSDRDQVKMLSLMRRLLARSRTSSNWPVAYDPWEMREVEHWLCEYAKWRNAQAGLRLKRGYAPAGA